MSPLVKLHLVFMKRCINANSAIEFIVVLLCEHKAMMSPASSGTRLPIGQRRSPLSTNLGGDLCQEFILDLKCVLSNGYFFLSQKAAEMEPKEVF